MPSQAATPAVVLVALPEVALPLIPTHPLVLLALLELLPPTVLLLRAVPLLAPVSPVAGPLLRLLVLLVLHPLLSLVLLLPQLLPHPLRPTFLDSTRHTRRRHLLSRSRCLVR